jgi:hypothetical protein
MDLFSHHLYEYKKGLRRLVLHTTPKSTQEVIEHKLERAGISYLTHEISGGKINIFFGDDYCVTIVRTFGKRGLSELSDEEDFILGVMLGYDLVQQCERYLHRRGKHRRAG